MQEWYKLELISHPEYANISEKDAAKILLAQLDARNIEYIGENFESEEWGYWETLDDDLQEISKLIPGILITAEVETDGSEEDKCYAKYYARDGQIETVFGQIVYPKCSHKLYPDPKKEYLEGLIQQEISFYKEHGIDSDGNELSNIDLIYDINNTASQIESICTYATRFGDISHETAATITCQNNEPTKEQIRKYQKELVKRGYFADSLFEILF